jgi:hypothetical protein
VKRLPVFGEADRRDRLLRWVAVVGVLAATQLLGVAISLSVGFWDVRLFVMLASPVLGVALAVFGQHMMRRLRPLLQSRQSSV